MQVDHLDRFSHIVDAQQVRPPVHRPSMQGSRSVQRVVARDFQDFLNHGFAADANKDGTLQRNELREGVEQGIVVRDRLAKPKPDVHNDVCQARIVGPEELGLEVLVDVADHIVVGRVGLHRFGGALHVHQHVGRFGVRNDFPHVWIGVASGDVVDEVGAGVQRSARHRGVKGVDAEQGVRMGRSKGGQDGREARPFFVRTDLHGARPRRLGSEVKHVGPFTKHPLGLGDRASRVVPRPAVVKRIGREVEDAHHPSLVKIPQGTTDRNRRGQDLHCNLPQVSMDTLAQYDACLATCEDLFKRKTQDYGTAWRILRPSSLTDQIFIKANRIRTIQQVGESKVDEGVESEFIGIVNYCFMAMLQCRLPEDAPMELSVSEANRLYDEAKDETRSLMQKKNHDYGEAWRDMRISSLTDLILMKVLRVKQIENNDGQTVASEGVEANYMDMANYALFALILSSEGSSE